MWVVNTEKILPNEQQQQQQQQTQAQAQNIHLHGGKETSIHSHGRSK